MTNADWGRAIKPPELLDRNVSYEFSPDGLDVVCICARATDSHGAVGFSSPCLRLEPQNAPPEAQIVDVEKYALRSDATAMFHDPPVGGELEVPDEQGRHRRFQLESGLFRHRPKRRQCPPRRLQRGRQRRGGATQVLLRRGPRNLHGHPVDHGHAVGQRRGRSSDQRPGDLRGQGRRRSARMVAAHESGVGRPDRRAAWQLREPNLRGHERRRRLRAHSRARGQEGGASPLVHLGRGQVQPEKWEYQATSSKSLEVNQTRFPDALPGDVVKIRVEVLDAAADSLYKTPGYRPCLEEVDICCEAGDCAGENPPVRWTTWKVLFQP